MGFELERALRARLPEFQGLSKPFWQAVGKIIVTSILQNILNQKQADGSPIKRNAPSTLEAKRRMGRGSRSLVDALHRFVQGGGKSWRVRLLRSGESRAGTSITHTYGGVEVSPAPTLAVLNRHVQEKGYIGWLGINKSARNAIRLELRKEVRRQFRRAASG